MALLYSIDFLEQNNIQMKDPKCRTEDGGRISLTLRDVRTFLDVKTQRLFGQGISSSCDSPQLTEEGLRQATVAMRQEDAVDRNRAVVVAAAIGVGAGFASFDKARGKSSIELIEMIRSVAIPTISATASYFYLRHLRNSIRQHRDEMEARDFFSKKSASGNNYEIKSL